MKHLPCRVVYSHLNDVRRSERLSLAFGRSATPFSRPAAYYFDAGQMWETTPGTMENLQWTDFLFSSNFVSS